MNQSKDFKVFKEEKISLEKFNKLGNYKKFREIPS